MKGLKTFFFDTGVKFSDYPYLYGNQVNKGGVKQIPFDVADSIPDSATLMYLCDTPTLPASKRKNIVVVPVFNTDMASKYAYFRL